MTFSGTIPQGLQLVSGSNPYNLGDIWDGNSSNVNWTFLASEPGMKIVQTSASSNSYGETFSDSESIYIEVLTIPLYPLLTFPGNGAHIADRTPTFTWNTPQMARWYKIQVDDDEGYISPEIDLWVDTNSFTPLSDMEVDSFNWRVFSWNACGISPPSQVWTFTIEEGTQVYLPLINCWIQSYT